MVKRIKKRVEKPEEQPVAEEAAQEPAPEDVAEQLGQVGQDEFTEYTAHALQWVVKHRMALLGAIGLVMVAVVIGSGIVYYRESKAHEVSGKFFEAASNLRDARQPTPAMLGDDTPDQPAGPSAEERKGKLEKARAGFEALDKEHSGTPLARLGKMGLASTELALGRPAEAAGGYEQVAADAGFDNFERAIALQGQAVALESAGRAADAVAAWQKVAAIDAKTFGLYAGLQVGRLLEAQGKTGEAKAVYEKLKSENTGTAEDLVRRSLRDDLDQRLAKLGAGA